MTTIIDNNQRVFLIVTTTGKNFFCNLSQLNYVVCSECKTGYFKIYHFWNNKPKFVTKKFLKEIFEGHRIKQEFYY